MPFHDRPSRVLYEGVERAAARLLPTQYRVLT